MYENKIYSDGDLPLKETLQLYNSLIAARDVLHEGNKYYPEAFLDTYWYKL